MYFESKAKMISVPKLPARAMIVLVPFFLSLAMSGIVSFISIARSLGINKAMLAHWLEVWPFSWMVAFPSVFLLLPIARKLSSLMVKKS